MSTGRSSHWNEVLPPFRGPSGFDEAELMDWIKGAEVSQVMRTVVMYSVYWRGLTENDIHSISKHFWYDSTSHDTESTSHATESTPQWP
jgi:hypothetical protein